MTLRRLVAFAMVMTVLHLNVVRAEAMCAAHHGQTDESASPVGSEDHADHTGEEQTDAQQCASPIPSDCCQAMAACAIVLGVDADALAGSFPPLHFAVGTAITSQPLSRVTAPEPPPPKA